MLTKEKLFSQLEEMGAPKDRPVIVHTALRKVGQIDGGGEALLSWLVEYFTQEGGLLCIPTHTWAYQDDKSCPTLDLLQPRTCLGMLPALALRRTDGVRSMHPTHSMMVFGAGKEAFVAGEEQVQTTTAPQGCYGKLHRMGGKVLLIGVGQEKNTFLHCVEEMLNIPNRIGSIPMELTVRLPNGEMLPRKLYPLEAEGIYDVSQQFPNYEPAFRDHGCIMDGLVGLAAAQLCDTEKMRSVMERIFLSSEGKEMLFDDTPIDPRYYK